jgi:hypothetical protein
VFGTGSTEILAENYTYFPYFLNIMTRLAVSDMSFAGAEGTYASRSFLFLRKIG